MQRNPDRSYYGTVFQRDLPDSTTACAPPNSIGHFEPLLGSVSLSTEAHFTALVQYRFGQSPSPVHRPGGVGWVSPIVSRRVPKVKLRQGPAPLLAHVGCSLGIVHFPTGESLL
jgi:hypothetical protein